MKSLMIHSPLLLWFQSYDPNIFILDFWFNYLVPVFGLPSAIFHDNGSHF